MCNLWLECSHQLRSENYFQMNYVKNTRYLHLFTKPIFDMIDSRLESPNPVDPR